LKALQGLARNAAMFLPLQAAFRKAGGFPLLVKLLDIALPPQPPRYRASGGGSSGDGSGGGSSSSYATAAAAAPDNGGTAGHGSAGGGESAAAHGGSTGSGGSSGGGQQEAAEGDAWADGTGAQRISPAVEALTMLARNNPKNRCASD